MEKNFPPFATKTTAEHRVNAYIPEEIAIPKPCTYYYYFIIYYCLYYNYFIYIDGKHAPFKPSELGANIRHFRKPVVKEIEI